MIHFYRLADKSFEYCFNIETSSDLTGNEIGILTWLLSETFQQQNFSGHSFLEKYTAGGNVLEFGPRLNFETAYSTNAVAICHSCGLTKILRLERSRRYAIKSEDDKAGFSGRHHDRMTEYVYERKLLSFKTGIEPLKSETVPIIEEGTALLEELNLSSGFGFDSWDIDFYYNLFAKDFKRNPTNVELYHLSQANSEHSRHWFFKGRLIVKGEPLDYNLIELVRSTLKEHPSNSLVAFSDNSSVISGYEIKTIIPEKPGFCCPFQSRKPRYHIIFTAETHNFPSGVAPFPGAETGTGGRIRDVEATGRGGLVIAGTAGYAAGNLNIVGYDIPGEGKDFKYPQKLASPLKILIEESNGASDYGNKFGEPVIQGFVRTFGQVMGNGERKEWIKPIMFTGGIGQIDNRHLYKAEPEPGMLVVQVGGPAYRIGMGGGSASSLIQGENRQELDFNAVQRGNAEMEQKLNRVVRACAEMGDDNPVLSIHDQGAGGPCNVITEIINPAGARIDIGKIAVGDRTMSVLEIWTCEYQERNALLIYPDRLGVFVQICRREKVNCEVLGNITGDGRITVYDGQDDYLHVNLELSKILGNIPQKTFILEETDKKLIPLALPPDLSLRDAVRMVFALPSVGSKGYLVRKVDRSVTGLIVRQQCCGPLQLPVSDVAVVSQSHFSATGAAISIGEAPLKILVDPAAGGRMAVAEAITNIMWARLSGLNDIKCSVNWMWPAKLEGEGIDLLKTANAVCELMKKTGIAADGGKDSVSMAAEVGGEVVKSPGEVVISAYCTVPDITDVLTPDIKKPSESILIAVDFSKGKCRLGGSALAQCFSQIGDNCPDIEDSRVLTNAFEAVQQLIEKKLLLSGHDISDGGLITAVSEMIMSGNCGAELCIGRPAAEYSNIRKEKNTGTPEEFNILFSEEAGFVIEVAEENTDKVKKILNDFCLPFYITGRTLREKKLIVKNIDGILEEIRTDDLLLWWEATSDELEKFQQNPDYSAMQKNCHIRGNPSYNVTFSGMGDLTGSKKSKPRIAIIREEGSNGDREMASAFFMAGFETWDVTMTDLLQGSITLDYFNGAAFVGGFSYADVLDSAKGWAGIIRFNPALAEMFNKFYERKDTFSLGVCNGCQLLSLLGWVPWAGISQEKYPRFISNPSGRFESGWVTVKILESPSIMLSDMQDSVLGIWVAHREGHLHFPDREIFENVVKKGLCPVVYLDDTLNATERYPFNPNSSPSGITALCSNDGRHLAIMPHPERSFMMWQWPWVPENFKNNWVNGNKNEYDGTSYSPWLKMFLNAGNWCRQV